MSSPRFRILLLAPSVAAGCVSAGLVEPRAGTAHLPYTPATAIDIDTLPDVPTLPDLVRVALRGSPALGAARASADAAGGRAWQAELWPNPSLRLEARDVPRDRMALRQGEEWATLMQPLPYGARRGAAIDAARLESSAAGYRAESERRDLVARVATAWADAVHEQERQEFVRRLGTIARRRADLAAVRVAGGSLAQSASLDVRIEAEKSEIEAKRADRDVESRLAELAALIGGPPLLRVSPAMPALQALPERVELARIASEGNPVLEAARRSVEAAARRVDEAKSARTSDVELMLAVGRAPSERTSFVEAGVTIPLPVFDRNQGGVREARAMLAEAQANERNAENEHAAEVVLGWNRVASAREELAAWRERLLLPAEQSHARAAAAFAQGTRSEDETLATERTLLETRLVVLRAERDLRAAEFELRRHLPDAWSVEGSVR